MHVLKEIYKIVISINLMNKIDVNYVRINITYKMEIVFLIERYKTVKFMNNMKKTYVWNVIKIL